MAAQMAEYAVLAVLREFREARRLRRAQRAGHWSPQRPRDGRTFGIGVLGAGVLGAGGRSRRCAVRLPARGLEPNAPLDARRRVVRGRRRPAGVPRALEDAGRAAAVAPTRRADLLDADALALLPSGAHVVNIGRGALIVEADLLAAARPRPPRARDARRVPRGAAAAEAPVLASSRDHASRRTCRRSRASTNRWRRSSRRSARSSAASRSSGVVDRRDEDTDHGRATARSASASSTSVRATACRTRRRSCRPTSRSR